MHMIYNMVKDSFGDNQEEYEKKIKFLKKLERTYKRIPNL